MQRRKFSGAGGCKGRGVAREKKKMALRHFQVAETLCQHLGFNLDSSANYCSFCYRSTAACWQSNGDVILFSNRACFNEKSPRKYPVRYATFQHSRLLCTTNAALPPSAHCVAISTKALLWMEKVMLSLRKHCFCIGHHDADQLTGHLGCCYVVSGDLRYGMKQMETVRMWQNSSSYNESP